MGNARVFIIEDDGSFPSDLQEKLTSLGYQAESVSRPVALHRIQENRPDIVLVNLHPGNLAFGVQAAEEIRLLDYIPLVFITPEINEETLQQLKVADPDGFLIRPVSDAQIRTTLELALHHRQLQGKNHHNQSQTSAILKSIGDGVIAIDGQTRVLFMNPVAVALTGWQEQEAIGQPVDSVVKIYDEAIYQEIELSGLVKNLLKTGRLNDYDFILGGRSGRHIPVEMTIAPMRGQSNGFQGTVIGIRDTSELHKSLQELQMHASRSETLLGIIAKFNSHLDLDSLLSSLLEETTSLVGADISAAFLASEDEAVYRIVSTYSVNEAMRQYRGADFDINHEIFDQLEPVDELIFIIPNVQEVPLLPYREFLVREDIRTIVIARLQRNRQVFGALAIANVGRVREYSQIDLQFIKGLADQASIAIINARLFEHMQASRSRLQTLSKRLVDVQEAERRSLARELHDQVGQMLTGLNFSLEFGKRKADGELKSILEESQEMVSGLMKQIRDLSMRLLPAMLDDMGLLPTLTWMFDNYTRQTGIQVQFTHSGMERRFQTGLEMTTYRIIQESLTNVARYAHTNEVFVRLRLTEAVLRIQVKDLGVGFDTSKLTPGASTFGLTSMRERAFLAGGQLTIKSAPDKGTEITASLPVEAFFERRKHDR